MAFERALNFVLRKEGGWSDHPSDPGGATMRGITLATYRAWRASRGLPEPTKADLRNISDDEVREIYRANYWDACRCDDLPPPIALNIFDMAVNAGPARAIRLLQQALGVTEDGIIGPETLGAARSADQRDLAIEYGARRIVYYGNLSTFSTFGLGWTRRTLNAIGASLALAAQSANLSPSLAGPEPEFPGLNHSLTDEERTKPVERYNKAIGAIVGGLVGIALAAFGVTETAVVPDDWQPVVATIVTAITALLGTYIAPKNKD